MLTDNEIVQIAEFLGDLSYEPYKFVIGAFPWGEGELSGMSGPSEWGCT